MFSIGSVFTVTQSFKWIWSGLHKNPLWEILLLLLYTSIDQIAAINMQGWTMWYLWAPRDTYLEEQHDVLP